MLGNPEEFGVCVTMNGKLLCKSPLKVPSIRSGGSQLYTDATTIARKYFKDNTENPYHANKYLKRKIWKNNFLWTGPACAFGLLVLLVSTPFSSTS